MDFLKSAVASAISKGPAFGYSFDDRVDLDNSIWTLHNGTKREDGSKCSVFSFDVNAGKSRLQLARNALRKLRTLRHPGVIKVLDTVETESYIYIATERLTPLSWHVRRNALTPETIKWGLHSVAKTVKFINHDAHSIHGNIRTSSVFTSESGEWKLGGFEILSSVNEDDAVIYTYGSLLPDGGRYLPPEIGKTGWESIKKHPIHCLDAYLFGILIWDVFNGPYMSADQLSLPKLVPVNMQASYKRLIAANPKARISAGAFLEQGMRIGGFFETPLIQLTDGIESLGLKTEEEREEIFGQLEEVADDFPEDFFKMKVLPELIKSVEFGGGGPKVFAVIMKISGKLSEDEYEQKIVPVVIRLFASQDRAMRVCLLDNLPLMIDHFTQKLVSNNIFPQMVTGFSDVAPLVREQTVKAVLTVVPKLTDRIINGELLRHLAKTANDEQPGIRTNTTICLGKMAKNLGTGNRAKVLIAAFSRGLRDPFLHARNAALQALAATADVFSDEDCATKILPGLCPSLIDKEKTVRDQATKTMDLFMQRVRKYAETLPDTLQTDVGSGASQTPRPAVQSESSWAGWAISSFTNKLTTVSGEMQGRESPAPEARPQSVPQMSGLGKPPVPANPARNTTVTSIKSPKATTNPFAQVAEPLTSSETVDDFDASWGDEQGPWAEEDGDKAPDFDPFSSLPTESTASGTITDDKGEPDFAGWLNNQSKGKAKKPLPKGLAKSTKPLTSRPAPLKANSTPAAARPTKAAKPAPQPKEEEDDDWGDAWS